MKNTRHELEWGRDILIAAGVPSPHVDARLLMLHVLNIPGFELGARPEISAHQAQTYRELVQQRAKRIPLQRILGTAAFRFLEVAVRDGVFVPRPETEAVMDEPIAVAKTLTSALAPDQSILCIDLCCGSGVMGLSLATEVPRTQVHSFDKSPAAAELTAHNADQLNATNLFAYCLDVAQVASSHPELVGTVDFVVANPPYIPTEAVPRDPEVRDHDPEIALYGGGDDGLQIPRVVVEQARLLLRPGGYFWMEHGDEQGPACRELVQQQGGFTEIRTGQDLTGRDRFVTARRLPPA